MEAPREPRGSPLRAGLVVVFAVMMFFTLALAVGSFPAGWYTVFVGHISSTNFDASSLIRPYLWLGPVLYIFPFQATVGASFLVLTAVYLFFLVYSARQKEGIVRAVSMGAREGFGRLFESPLAVVLIATGFLVFAGSIIDSLVSSSGVPVGNLVGDPLILLFGFTLAPLVEEFGFRMVLVGVIAFVLTMGRPPTDGLKALWRPSSVYEGAAVGGGASMIIWAATGFSAVTFGACHVLCGSSWDIGKFPEAAFGGAVLGFLYVKYGFHVAVLAHWGVDYLGSVYSFFGQAAYGIRWDSTTKEFVGQYLVDIDMLLLFGLASTLVVAYLGLKWLASRKSGHPSGFEVLKPQPGGQVGET